MEDLTQVYVQKLKVYILPLIIVVISIFALWQIFLPQVFAIPDTNKKIEDKRTEVEELDNSYQTITKKFNNQTLNDNLTLTEQALPPFKDISTIYTNIILAATNSDVQIKSFKLQVGNIYNKKKRLAEEQLNMGYPVMNGEFQIGASSLDKFISFNSLIHRILPISEIKKFSIQKENGTYTIVFYYKTYDPIFLAKQTKISPLSPTEQEILKKVEEFKRNSPQ